MRKIIKKVTFVISVLCFIIISLIVYYSIKLPDSFCSDSGKNFSVQSKFNIKAVPSENISQTATSETIPETATVRLMLMGTIPVKDAEVRYVERPELIPCGKPFGIKMIMNGIMVIRTGTIPTETGSVSPAADAGIVKGDIIKSVNGSPVFSNRDMESKVHESDGNEVTLCVIRDEKEMEKKIKPAVSIEDNELRLGLWVRDSSSGIGTITYCDGKDNTFGALGHPVCDADTGKIIPLFTGEIMNVNINGLKKGRVGNPGELHGYFCETECCGMLSTNNIYGVFGTIDDDFTGDMSMPVALRHEVNTGHACIYSTIEGSEPECFDIEIKKINYNDTDSARNMIIKVTDPVLIEKTGGIVQGMSGSPIIQNNTLVGAVTHVFVNDPTMGYAVFCENMYEMSHAG